MWESTLPSVGWFNTHSCVIAGRKAPLKGKALVKKTVPVGRKTPAATKQDDYFKEIKPLLIKYDRAMSLIVKKKSDLLQQARVLGVNTDQW